MKKNDRTFSPAVGAYTVILLILTALFLGSCDTNKQTNISKEWDRTHEELQVTVKLYDNNSQLINTLTERLGSPVNENTLGKAIMSPNDNICEVYALKPRRIDDQRTMTIGHELLHCLYGRYHPE